ncbi:dihydrofolate reductase-like domain-containing protein [Aspergillus avenaceus]|uniref:2,5-diamino-6-ribosylamino-4(3H)-pyrimidinone 5'-phosphate reductase n=1 Tax=Aspergillus avenaceus TaxID=36643 RepID=A0A5N6U0G7_ASPAV|nr:dihydrofolate reductase-like domain-containing protein [Aspergillus avenaceus]
MSQTRSWTARVFIATSLDGYIAHRDGDIRWLTEPTPDPDHIPPSRERAVDNFDQHMARVDRVVMGRKTYEKVLSLPGWQYGDTKVIVLSRTMRYGVHEHTHGVVEVINDLDDLRETFEREIVRRVYVDGGEVVQTFLQNGWVDEIILTTAPILLGRGIPLFGYLHTSIRLTLLGTDVIDNGMISCRYKVLN